MIEGEFKDKETNLESLSIYNLLQFLSEAQTVAIITPITSAYRELKLPRFAAKQPICSPLQFQKIHAQAACVLLADPSVLHLIQLCRAVCQKTSKILGDLG
jgi:hypothetical protein